MKNNKNNIKKEISKGKNNKTTSIFLSFQLI